MNLIFLYILMAIGLSVDAFSLAVIYGMNKISIKKTLVLSISVGVFHFLMPHLGSVIGLNLLTNIVDKANLLVGVVFLIIAIEMILSLKEEQKEIKLSKLYQIIFFAFTVSLDSFSVGIVLSLAHEQILVAGIIFAVVSFLFTYIGLKLGYVLSKKYSDKAVVIGSIILIILSFRYIFLV